MGEHNSQKERTLERGSRFFRNLNALAAAATGAVAVLIPPLSAPFSVLTGINIVQAGGFEVARRTAKKRRLAA